MTQEDKSNDSQNSKSAEDHNNEATLTTPTAPGPLTGQNIGPYGLLQILGEGGMGSVYLAEQTKPIKRKVALKVIKLGMDTKEVVARFESERQALAQLNHPNIAKVLDAGSTREGRPFFVMEYVKGIPVTEYCDKHHLDTKARLTLFISVCEAVHHAHQKGIIHRDLKPQNVLVEVSDGLPVAKVIDFGVAKATDQRLTEKTLFTQHGHVIGTPAYMSPEQAEMLDLDIDTTTDVYSLGVMLYELLSGVLPLDPKELQAAGWRGIQDKIRDHQPKRISTVLGTMGAEATNLAAQRGTTVSHLIKQCRNELDWITLRAMEKDRTQRYQSASEFAADIKRYLGNEPVLAHRPSLNYQMRKLITRHKLRFGLAASLVVLLAGFAVTTTLQAGRIARERDRANREATTAEHVSDFLVGLFEVSDPSEARGNTITAREILDEGADRITTELQDQPLVKAEMLGVMGEVYMGLGLYDQAEPLLDESLEIRLSMQEQEPLEVSESYSRKGMLAQHMGEYDQSVSYFESAIKIQERELGPFHPELAQTISNYGSVLNDLGKFEKAEAQHRQALAILERTLGPDHIELTPTLSNLGGVLSDQGDYEGAKLLYKRALKIEEKALGPDHPTLGTTLSNLGIELTNLGDYEGAKLLYERSLKIGEKALGPDHPTLAATLGNFGIVLRILGDYEGAKLLFERALKINEKALGPDHPTLATTLSNLSTVLGDLGDYEGAKLLLERSLKIKEKALGPDHPSLGATLSNLGTILFSLSDYEGAKLLFERALKIEEKALGPDHPSFALTLSNLSVVLRKLDDNEGAKLLTERSLKIQEKALGSDHPTLAGTLNSLGNVLSDLDDYEGAKLLYGRALAIQEEFLRPDDPSLAQTMVRLGRMQQQLGYQQEAERLCDRAHNIAEKSFDLKNRGTANLYQEIGALRKDLDDLQGAKIAYENALAIRQEILNPNHPDLISTMNLLGNVLHEMGETKRAEQLLQRARVAAGSKQE